MKRFVVNGVWSNGASGFLWAADEMKDSEWSADLNRCTWYRTYPDAANALVKHASYTILCYNRSQTAVPESVNNFLNSLRVIEIETDEIYWQ